MDLYLGGFCGTATDTGAASAPTATVKVWRRNGWLIRIMYAPLPPRVPTFLHGEVLIPGKNSRQPLGLSLRARPRMSPPIFQRYVGTSLFTLTEVPRLFEKPIVSLFISGLKKTLYFRNQVAALQGALYKYRRVARVTQSIASVGQTERTIWTNGIAAADRLP